MQLTSYEEVKQIIKELLILANYPIEGNLDDGTETPTYQSRVSLQRFVRAHDTQSLIKQEEMDDDDNSSVPHSYIAAKKKDTQWLSDMIHGIE